MRRIALVCFWGYTGMLLVIGASGILIAPWELTHIFSIPLDSLSGEQRASILNQYRFLKSAEFAFGIFCVTHRAAIFDGGLSLRIFLCGVFAGVFARLLSLLVDGVPQWAFLTFAALELVTGVLVWRAARSAVTHPPRHSRLPAIH
jgi:hypothetical protein